MEQIAARLDDRFRLLTGGSRMALPRHQTLQATMEWSYDLLSEQERTVLRRLSVFAGGWTLGAAEAVCAGGGIEASDILDLLTQLVDKSLVVVETQGGEARYGLLETVRQYGWDRLVESREATDVRTQHRDWYLGLVEEGCAALVGSVSPHQWLRRLQDEHDNMRTALRWSIDHQDLEGAAHLGCAMSHFWHFRGFYREGRGWLQELLEKGQHISLRARAKVLSRAGDMAYAQADLGEAVRLGEEGLALFRALGDQEEMMVSLCPVGVYNMWIGNYERAAALLDESIALARQRGDLFIVAEALHQRGHLAMRRGDYGLATTLLEESLSGLRQVASKGVIGFPLFRLGLV